MANRKGTAKHVNKKPVQKKGTTTSNAPAKKKNVQPQQVPVKKKKKLSPKERRRRRIKKRIKAFSVLFVLILIIVFAIKCVLGLIADGDAPSSNADPSGDADITISTQIKPDNREPETDTNSDVSSNTSDENYQEDPSDETLEPEVTPMPSETPYLGPSPAPSEKPEESSEPSPTVAPEERILVGVRPEPNEYCTLVNANNPLKDDFKVKTATVKGTQKAFDNRVVHYLERMLDDAAAAGYPMYLVSTHRSISYQDGLFQKKVNEYISKGYNRSKAEEEAAKWVAPPGTSEHNLGLVADIVSSDWYQHHGDLTDDFEETEHFKWLYENCANYGFILRYPKGATRITGIEYEPWHYRYVGTDIAHYIMNNKLTLEEYLAL